jgi:hypothetical protein
MARRETGELMLFAVPCLQVMLRCQTGRFGCTGTSTSHRRCGIDGLIDSHRPENLYYIIGNNVRSEYRSFWTLRSYQMIFAQRLLVTCLELALALPRPFRVCSCAGVDAIVEFYTP